ncbi:MAG: hypothetical protein IJ589_02835 [Lachnospiraceae bacterium]|nr:hypothetical protein [Lachnospiraceae bacterium]
MSKMGDRIYGFCSRVLYALFFLTVIYLLLLSCMVTGVMAYEDRHIFFIKDVGPVWILIAAFLMFILAKIRWKAVGEAALRKICIISAVVFVVFQVWAITSIHLMPASDQGVVWNAAMSFLQGDYEKWIPGNYMDMAPHQNGMMLMMLPFAYFFGAKGAILFQCFNVLLLVAFYAALGGIAAIYRDNRAGYLTFLASLLITQLWTLPQLVYGYVGQICFCTWGLFFLIRLEREKRLRDFVFCLLCFQIGLVWKNNGALFIIAACLILVIDGIRKKRAEYVIACVILGATAWLNGLGITALIELITGIHGDGGVNLLGYLVTGINDSSIAPGWYNNIHIPIYEAHHDDPALMNALFLERTKQQLSAFSEDKLFAIRFFSRKLASTWADPAFGFFAIICGRNFEGLAYGWKDVFYNGGVINTLLYAAFDAQQVIMYLGAVLYCVWKLKDKKTGELLEHGHLLVVFFGGFLYYLIFETQSYEVMVYYLFLVPYALSGIVRTIRALAEKAERRLPFSVLGGLTALLAGLVFIPSDVVDNSFRIDADNAVYIWYFQNDDAWKADTYRKQ